MTRPSRLRALGAGSRGRIRGFTVIELGVVITVIGILASVYARYGVVVAEEQRGKNIGQVMATIHNAAEDYARRYRTEILNDAAITVPAAVAVTRSPTTADFFALGHTPNSITAAVARAGNIQIRLSPSPAACVMPACEIQILTYIDGPVLKPNANAIATTVLAVATREAGARAGGSEAFAPTRLRGLDGAWDAANPVAGNPVGIFAMLSSTADIGMTQYVQVRDSRDPDLQGNLSVAGNVAANGTLTVAGTTTLNGAATIAGATTIGGATTINSTLNVTGSQISATGNLLANSVVPTGSYAVNTACSNNGAIGQSLPLGSGMVVCQLGTWRAMAAQAALGGACANGAMATDSSGLSLLCVNNSYLGMDSLVYIGVAGAACANEGRIAKTTAGNNLICKDAIYWPVSDLLGRQGVMSLTVYTHGSTIPAHTCGGGLVPRLIPMGVVAACSISGGGSCVNNTGSFQGSISPTRVVSVVGSDGVTPAGNGQLTVAAVCSTY